MLRWLAILAVAGTALLAEARVVRPVVRRPASRSWSFQATGAFAAPGVALEDLGCHLMDYSGGSSFTCAQGSLVMNKTGTVTASVATPWYPTGFAGMNSLGATYDGSTGFFAAANTSGGNPTGSGLSLMFCIADKVVTDGAAHRVGGKSGATVGTAAYSVSISANSLLFGMGNGTATSSHTITGALANGAWYGVCVSYDGSGGDNLGVMRSNINGVAPAETTTAHAPMLTTSSQPFELGARAGALFSKDTAAHFHVWTNFTGTAAQLTAMVMNFWGVPVPWVVSRAATRACVPITSGSTFTLGANAPCVADNGLFIDSTTAIDNVSIPNNGVVSDQQGEVCATVQLPTGWTAAASADQIVSLNEATGMGLRIPANNQAEFFDGTNTVTATLTAGSMIGRNARLCSSWGADGIKVWEVGDTKASGSYDGAWVTTPSSVFLGSLAGTSRNLQAGWISKVCFSSLPWGCE